MITTLGNVCHFLNGGTPSKEVSSYFEGDIPWITSADIIGPIAGSARSFITEEAIKKSATNRVPTGTVLLVTRTGVGKVAIAGKDLCFSQDITALIPDSSILDGRYLVQYLRTKQSHFERRARGATIKGITRDVVADLSIPLPPISEQIRIAAILDQADALRVKRRVALAQLDSLTQSIFVEMFGDPVTNPKGWEVNPINDLPLHISDGNYSSKYPTSSEFVASGVPFIRANNLQGLTINGDDLRFITPKKHQELAKGHLCERDVLLVSRGDIGKVGLVPPQFHDANINAQLVLIRCTSKQIEPEYLCHLFNNSRMAAYVKNFETGVALKQLPIGNLKKVCLPIPPSDLQTEFSNIVRSAEKQSTMQMESLQGLDAMFGTLQHRAFRGEL